MRNLKLVCFLILMLLPGYGKLFPQNIKTYQGNYENGTATYQYYENENYERIYHGNFKYKATLIDDVKGKLILSVTGQYKLDKKDGIWTYTLSDPYIKGATEVVSGNYFYGIMDGEWTSVTSMNNTKKIIRKTVAQFKNNKLTGEFKFDFTSNTLKDYSSISIKGNFNDSSQYSGVWLTDYTRDNIQYEEIRKYRNGVIYLYMHRRLSDGAILEKMDSTDFVNLFFDHYDPTKKITIVRNQKYVFNDNPDKYSGSLELPALASDYWTKNNQTSYFTSLSELNPIFMIRHGYTSAPVFHEKIIVNWKNTRDGEKQSWQDEQYKKASDEKFKNLIIKADSTFKGKLFASAILLYKDALLIKDDPYAKEQIQQAQQIIDKETITREQEQNAKEKAYDEIIAKADLVAKEKKYDAAIDLYQSALDIKKDEKYPKDQIRFIKQIQDEDIRLKLALDMDKLLVTVEGGTFRMGCMRTDINCLKNEEPVHDVTLNTFQICKYEVTVGQYKVFCKIKGLKEPTGADSLPVTNITWNDASAFAEWLGYRLPTEAEWEYAARGGIKNRKLIYSGGNDLDEVAWYNENALNKPHTVGTKKPNTIGIYDMTGNVWEWCSDWYSDYHETNEMNPAGPDYGIRRIKRGGSFSETNYEADLRITNRASEPPEFSSYNLGMRLVKK